MIEFIIPITSAFWLGILTSISPCPLATNIAAISFVGHRVNSPANVLFSGLLYTLGRSLSYMALGIILVSSILSAPYISHLLQRYMNKALGPILIFVGLILLNIIRVNISGFGIGQKIQMHIERMGMLGPLLLGVIFALSFCPVSAALFFGSLIPIALQSKSVAIIPSVYGIATGLPVFIFAFLIAVGAKHVGDTYNKLIVFEKWARLLTGSLFILVGIYYCLTYIFGLYF